MTARRTFGYDKKLVRADDTMLLWLVSGVALLLAATALLVTSRVSRRLSRVSQSYWDLRYEHDRLRERVDGGPPADTAREPRQPPAGAAFVPLSSVRR